MKVSVFPFVVAALGFAAQVSAGPIRIYVLAPENADIAKPDASVSSTVDVPVAHMRWGLAAAGAPQANTQPMIKVLGDWNNTNNDSKPFRQHRCAGGMRVKALTFSNWLREKVGLEPIALPPPPPHHLHFPHGRPMGHGPEDVQGDAKIIALHGTAQADGENSVVDGRPPFHHFHYHHSHHHHHRPHSFLGRVQRALMTLGPWEGRFVAFVIGCGIGSLLRMFYVLCIVTYRSFTARKGEEEVEVIFTDVEELPPPEYIPDQKVAFTDEKVSN